MRRTNADPLMLQVGPCPANFAKSVSGGESKQETGPWRLSSGASHPNFMLVFCGIICSPEVRVWVLSVSSWVPQTEGKGLHFAGGQPSPVPLIRAALAHWGGHWECHSALLQPKIQTEHLSRDKAPTFFGCCWPVHTEVQNQRRWEDAQVKQGRSE